MVIRALFSVSAVLCVAGADDVMAISDDANPWLAIENAVCVSHRGVDYSSQLGVDVQVSEAQWRGAAEGLPMHCYLSGVIEAQAFVIRLPTDWNQQLYNPTVLSGEEDADLSKALNNGYAVLFSAPSEGAQSLLQATVGHQYRELGTAD